MTFIVGRRFARPEESHSKLKVDFQGVPYNQTFDFVTRVSPTCLWRFVPGQFAKMSITRKSFGIFWLTFAYTLILTTSSPRCCEMTFIIGRCFAERQILKKWKRPYFLNWVEYLDKRLHKHWYWQDLAQEIAKWHFFIGRAFAERHHFWEKKMALSLELSGILW